MKAVRDWLRFWVLATFCILALTGARGCDPEPVTPPVGTGGYGDTPAVGGSGGWEDPFTGGTAGTGGMVCDAVERSGQPRSLKPRVVGGDDAPLGAFPWMCSIQASGWHYCGGNLIATNQVLTAAHCSVDVRDVVVCGRTVLSQSGGETRAVKAVRAHPGWYSTTSGNDIAILLLDAHITTISPIMLGSATADDQMLVLGWGRTSTGGPPSDHMQIAAVSMKSCAPYGSSIDSTMFCASGTNELGRPTDSCQGDSGSGLFQNGRVVGITSWGRSCALSGYPGVYTNVAVMLPWVQACLWSQAP